MNYSDYILLEIKIYLKILLGAFKLGGTHGPSKREICARNTKILRNAVRTSVLGQLNKYSQNLKMN